MADDAPVELEADGPAWAPGYRYATADVRPVPFRFRDRPEDFVVEETPLYPASGEGTHLYLTIEKRELSTLDAVRALARALGREEREFGFAGRKDTRAVTRQRISIEHADPDVVRALELPGLRILGVERHGNKLRVGHLAGNRFELVLRDVEPAVLPRIEAGLEQLERVGLPNYYGSQRFGRQGTTWKLGKLLLAGDADAYVRAFVSAEHGAHSPGRAELERVLTSGTPSARRRLSKLAQQLSVEQAALARQVARRPNSIGSAVRAIPLRTRLFHVSALQSRVFNRVLGARMDEPGGVVTPLAGDVVSVRGEPGTRRLEAADLEEARRAAAALELSPTGPIHGARCAEPSGRPAELERAALVAEGLQPEDFGAAAGRAARGMEVRGTRRDLRVPVRELRLTCEGDVVRLAFALPAGSYATTLLEELRKTHAPPRDSARPRRGQIQ
ncbi:MAG: tRNA pseudouridine(13) synthase TruD [bacterium]|nr:tRNA pseudouridine(13) synthase TruD [bacterium]